MARPGVRAWVARIDGDVAGLVELERESNGDVGIVIIGLGFRIFRTERRSMDGPPDPT